MAVNVIDTIKPKNNGTFPVVEAADVKITDTQRLDAALDAKANQTDFEALSATVDSKASQTALNALSNTVAGKQNALTTAQLTAVNSGITSALVTQIGTNTTAIAGKASLSDLATTNATVATKASTSDLTSATDNLQSQIDNIVTPVTQDAEVENARVGAYGKSYASLKARLDAEETSLNNGFASASSANGYITTNILSSDYVRGNASSTGLVDSTTRIRTSDYVPINAGDTLIIANVASGYKCTFVAYHLDKSLMIGGAAWRENGLAITIKEDGYVVPIVAKSDDSDILVNETTFNTFIISGTSEKISDISALLDNKIGGNSYTLKTTWYTNGSDATKTFEGKIDLKKKFYVKVTNFMAGARDCYYKVALSYNGAEQFNIGTKLVAAGSSEIWEIPKQIGGSNAYRLLDVDVKPINGIPFNIDVYYDTYSDFTNAFLGDKKILIVNNNNQAANEFAKPSDAVRYAVNMYSADDDIIIYIRNGVYTEVVDHDYEPYAAINIARTHISLIGESRENTIIQMTCTEEMQGRIVEFGGSQSIENLTFYVYKDFNTDLGHRPYCIHNDAGPTDGTHYTTVIRNVTCISECMPPIGAGLRDKQTQVYENVKTVYKSSGYGGQGSFYCHGASIVGHVPDGVVVDNCTFISENGTPAVSMSNVPDCTPYSETPTTFRRTITVTNGDTEVASNFKSTHALTTDSKLNSNSYLNA